MTVLGNVDKFKKRLEKVYERKLKDYKGLALKEEQQLRHDFETGKNAIDLNTKIAIERESKLEVRRIINKEKFRAKQIYEQKREEIISEVFSQALERAGDFVKSKDYIKYVKSCIPNKTGIVVKADSKDYDIKYNVKVKKGIIGIKAIDGRVIYDFTVQGLIDAKFESLRLMVDKELFGNVEQPY